MTALVLGALGGVLVVLGLVLGALIFEWMHRSRR